MRFAQQTGTPYSDGGEATKRLAKRYGGFGGGHKRAGGASIPRKDCIAFIKDLEIELC